MTNLGTDIRYAARTLRKSPGFAAVAIATLALGIGANTAIFSVLDAVLLRALPVPRPSELVLLRSDGPRSGHTWNDGDAALSFSHPMYRDLAEKNTVFSGLLAEYPFGANVSTMGRTEVASGELVSGNYFGVLGVTPRLGRVLTAEDGRDPGTRPVVVLSDDYWSRRFGRDASVLNKVMSVNGTPLTVVGVARGGFSGIQTGRRADFFVPVTMKAQMTPGRNGLDDPKDYWLQLVGRVKPGTSLRSAQAGLAPLYRSLLTDLLPRMTGMDAATQKRFVETKLELVPGRRGRNVLQSQLQRPLLALMTMVGLVLLIACSNLAGLLLARGAARQRDLGIRVALGAGRGRLMRPALFESLICAFAGGAAGIALASVTIKLLFRLLPPEGDLRQAAVTLDPEVLGFAALLSLLAGLLFGLAPAWRASLLDPSRLIRAAFGSAGSSGHEVIRLRRVLVSGQIALTLLLIVLGSLFAKSLRNLDRVPLGFSLDHLMTFSISPALNGYTPARTADLSRSLTESLRAIPGTVSASASEIAVLTGDDQSSNFHVQGRPAPPGDTDHVRENYIGSDYFSTLGVPLVAGREISARDEATTPLVAVINETMAQQFFGRENPIGARLQRGRIDPNQPSIEIIGVVRDSKAATLDEARQRFVYMPYLQDKGLGELTFYVRTSHDPASLFAPVRDAVRRIDPDLPVSNLKTVRAQAAESVTTERLMAILSAAFGALAALLAAIGVYGVLAYSVAQRTREIGVRVALGAQRGTIQALVLRDVVRFALAGTAIGIPAAILAGRAVESVLFGVRAANFPSIAGSVALISAVALIAGWLPARKAASVNPMTALRSE